MNDHVSERVLRGGRVAAGLGRAIRQPHDPSHHAKAARLHRAGRRDCFRTICVRGFSISPIILRNERRHTQLIGIRAVGQNA